MRKSFLFLLLFFFILFDIVLLTFLFFNNNPFNLFQKKAFKTNNPSYIFKRGEIKYTKSTNDNLSFATLIGKIKSAPYLDKKDGVYKLEIDFQGTKKRMVAILALGMPDRKLSISYAKDGLIKSDIGSNEWIFSDVSKISKHFKKNIPMIFSLDIYSEIDKIIDSPICNDICKKSYIEIKKLNSQNSLFIRQYQENKNEEKLEIGYPNFIILYE